VSPPELVELIRNIGIPIGKYHEVFDPLFYIFQFFIWRDYRLFKRSNEEG
jgi:hypothetical protein